MTTSRILSRLKYAFSSKKIPAVGKINFGHLRRLEPLSRDFGFSRGGPVDRYYIENFMEMNAYAIKGKVLEIKDDAYARKYGKEKVKEVDVLDIDADNKLANIIADLAEADNVPDNSYDCVILTQTLLLIYDLKSAIAHCYRILKPGGVLLVTVPGIVQMDYQALGNTWLWSFTQESCKRLFRENFAEDKIEVTYHGNVLAASSQLYGISAKELTKKELDFKDPNYQMLITVKATK